MFKNYIQRKLENYVRKYLASHPDIKLVAVGGSVGKTSTKIAVATVLSERYRVRLHGGNHNTHFSTPLAILGVEYPEKVNSIGSWISVFRAAKQRIKEPTGVDVIVQELGTDRIGEIAHFGTYLKPDIGIVTAVAPEHMEFFHDIDTVAREELALANFSKSALINRDDIDGEYSKYLTNANINTYGTNAAAEYYYISEGYDINEGHKGALIAPELSEPVPANIHEIGDHMLRPAMAAAATAIKLGMSKEEVVNGLAKVQAVPGRMNVLRGVENTTIIDDSYNSSPLALEYSLRTLYQINAPQKIVVLGDMNELGETSAAEHEKAGSLCDLNELAWVVTVGSESEKYLAPAARIKGCQVRSFPDAISAGTFVKSVLTNGAVVLFKGSQGGIFLEEAIKIMLHSTSDEAYLVRQSPDWMKRKSDFFSKTKQN